MKWKILKDFQAICSRLEAQVIDRGGKQSLFPASSIEIESC